MARKQAEAEFARFIHELGYDWKKFEDRRYCPHCHQLIYRVENMPFDGIATIRGMAIPVEIKEGNQSFTFADLEEHQRKGLLDWETKHRSGSWIFLVMGDGRPNSMLDNRRRAWLMPTRALLTVEGLLKDKADQVSIPYSQLFTNRVAIKEEGLTAVQQFALYELPWGKGGWELPENHIFAKIYGGRRD